MSHAAPIEILLVEDNPRDAEMTIRTLKEHHLSNKLVWVKDGVEALDLVFGTGSYAGKAPGRPSVILLDLKLPRVDGLEVLRQLKSDEQTRLIPVVVLTSSREEQDVVRSYRLGVNSYVVKPVGFEDFAQAVAQLGLYWVLLNQPLELPNGNGTTPATDRTHAPEQ